jgi:molybdopterin molybdotransferase
MSLLSFEAALSRLLATATAVADSETVPTQAARGRVLAMPLVSAIAVPPLDNSAMDGYAVRCADVPAVGTRLRIAQRIVAGSVGHTLAPGTAARIFTGAPAPAGADAVVMQELCAHEGDDVVINVLPHHGQAIRRSGEDIAPGAEVIAAGTRLGAAHLGLAASIGAARLKVFRRLRVALFCTGDELTMPGEALKPGGIYNSNRYTLHALLEGLGCVVADLGNVPDQLEATRAALRSAAQDNDLILTSGGVSVGEEDHIKPAVMAEGALDLWQIAIKPGKPLAFGSVRKKVGAGDTAAFIGLPGNPVASFITFLMLVRPFILTAQGLAYTPPRGMLLPADFSWKGDKRREFLRARRTANGSLELFAHQGSGVLTSCAWADGLIDNPPGQAIQPGGLVRFIPFDELV